LKLPKSDNVSSDVTVVIDVDEEVDVALESK